MDKVQKARLKMVLILAMYVLPLVIAWGWYSYVSSSGVDMGNRANGDLLEKTYPLEPFEITDQSGEVINLDRLHGKWALVQMEPAQCAEPCSKRLYNTRQLWHALGKEASRVQRISVFVDGSADQKMQASHPDMWFVAQPNAGLVDQLRSADGSLPSCNDCVYLLDPFSNVVIRFNGSMDLKDMKSDITRLLKNSRIG
ncbi:MAG: SCO family protein [Gammaproteobacteria bacterium]|nr:SCO family protein [Gammaproteobacteria bacterium]